MYSSAVWGASIFDRKFKITMTDSCWWKSIVAFLPFTNVVHYDNKRLKKYETD